MLSRHKYYEFTLVKSFSEQKEAVNQALTTLNFVNEYLSLKLRDTENVQNEKYYFQYLYYP